MSKDAPPEDSFSHPLAGAMAAKRRVAGTGSKVPGSWRVTCHGSPASPRLVLAERKHVGCNEIRSYGNTSKVKGERQRAS